MQKKNCYITNKAPFNYTLEIVGGKWKLKIIYIIACMEVVRYGALKKNIDGISHKVLSSQLNELENEGVILRKEYPQVPPKVEYSLTPKGQSIIPIIIDMCKWGQEHLSD